MHFVGAKTVCPGTIPVHLPALIGKVPTFGNNYFRFFLPRENHTFFDAQERENNACTGIGQKQTHGCGERISEGVSTAGRRLWNKGC